MERHLEQQETLKVTPSEKVEIARRIEESLAGRHGGDRKSSDKILPLDLPQGKSSDIAAKAVEMNRETYRQAKAVEVLCLIQAVFGSANRPPFTIAGQVI